MTWLASKRGGITLKALEREEVGPVSGKTLLHLQCHFGLDTMSWARLGAQATGVDFSDEAIELARALNAEVGTDARFIRSDVYDLTNVLDEEFDIVFTSYGVLVWLPDLDRWADVIRRCLKPGGTFYIVEFHPHLATLEPSGVVTRAHSIAIFAKSCSLRAMSRPMPVTSTSRVPITSGSTASARSSLP